MANRTDAADPLGYGGHFTITAAKAELLKATKFCDMEAGICHLTGIIQHNGDFGMALNPGDRGYGDGF